ncbi:MAG TPA: helix-turn-helix transcriptional regulator [Candidatus Saccharimonadales bacterium]|nr:helix-turn-helix transcriptional regulator [Candidatus Saccharimonadales bacterium]
MNSKDDNSIRKELGDKLRRAREKTGLTQAEVAAKAKLNDNYYAVIERGEANPSYEILQRVMKVLEIKSLDID